MDSFIKRAGWWLCDYTEHTHAEPPCRRALLLCLLPSKRGNTASEKLNRRGRVQEEGRVGRLLLITGIFMALTMRLHCLCVYKSRTGGLACFSREVRKRGIATDWADWSTHIWESCFSTKCPVISHLPHFLASHRTPPSRNAEGLTFSSLNLKSESCVYFGDIFLNHFNRTFI